MFYFVKATACITLCIVTSCIKSKCFCNLILNIFSHFFTLHFEYMDTKSKLQRIEFSSHVKFLILLVRSVEFCIYDFCIPKSGRNATDNHFPNFATADKKVYTMGQRGTPVLLISGRP